MTYKMTLIRPNAKPSATLKTTSPIMVAATIEAWLDRAPAEWFDDHGELTIELTHNNQPIDTAVLAEHIQQFHDLTWDDDAIAFARSSNPKRRERNA